MTLEGTNSWVLRDGDSGRSVVVDPGHHDPEHLALLVAAAGEVELVLLTHHHGDHADGAPSFAEQVGAPVRAWEASLCRGAEPLARDERIQAAGLDIGVLHTPGHTADSVTFVVTHAGEVNVLTGDTILGYGTTVLSDLGDYLDSLATLSELTAGAVGLPGHGPALPDLLATVHEYRDHREQRLDQVRAALAELGPDAGAREIVELVYADVDPALWGAAEFSVRAQLEYLARRR
ncbi:MAG: MBL fold metallo-hydrolase [Actinophytocola sp.]|nr:MBL fold metallo-hydrolase [Actinophytocola sp.]